MIYWNVPTSTYNLFNPLPPYWHNTTLIHDANFYFLHHTIPKQAIIYTPYAAHKLDSHMFQSDELNILHNNYFIIIKKKVNYVTLQSKDTWHCWHILHQEYATFKSCIIYHNHIPVLYSLPSTPFI